MTDSCKLEKLRRMVGADVSEDQLLLLYLADAEAVICNRLYPMDDTPRPMPERYTAKQIEIAVYLYNKRGAEGEISHNENGINRTYESAAIPDSMLRDIIPYGRVLS